MVLCHIEDQALSVKPVQVSLGCWQE